VIETRPGIDWQDVRARLERARQALDMADSRSPEEIRRILSERARALARPPGASAATDDRLRLLVIVLAKERYGIELAHIEDVLALRELTPVPCTPPPVLGVINHRGRVLPVLDLRRLFDLPGHGLAEDSRVVAVEIGETTVGLYSDGVEGIVEVRVEEISSASAILGEERQALLRGITGDMLGVLDLDALVRDARIAANDTVG
jgi:purine-binding chemotaxis protein CheW